MTAKKPLVTALLVVALFMIGCGRPDMTTPTASGEKPAPQPSYTKVAGPLPENGFKAQLTLVDAPTKLRAGQKQTIQVKVKNASDVQWYARGGELNTNPDNKFYLAVGNRWLKASDEKLLTSMDGRFGLPRDLKPGEETEVALQITAPKSPGEYILDVDLVQEQVAWFQDKASPTARAKVSVVK